MTTFRNLLGATALGVGLMFGFAAPQEASAAYVEVGPASPLILDFTQGPTNQSPDTVYYSPNADKVLWSENLGVDGPANQDPDTILTHIQTVFNDNDPLYTVGEIEGNGTNGNVSATGVGSGSGTFSSTVPFNYLAISYDAKQLYFYWDNPVNEFAIGTAFSNVEGAGLAQDISNYRAYAVVPVPAALPLLLTALGALGLIGRKKMMAA